MSTGEMLGNTGKLLFFGKRWTGPGTRFSKASETFRDHKSIFSSSVPKNGEVYTPKTSCRKGNSVYIKNMSIKQLSNRKVRDFAMALRAQNDFWAFEKQIPDI